VSCIVSKRDEQQCCITIKAGEQVLFDGFAADVDATRGISTSVFIALTSNGELVCRTPTVHIHVSANGSVTLTSAAPMQQVRLCAEDFLISTPTTIEIADSITTQDLTLEAERLVIPTGAQLTVKRATIRAHSWVNSGTVTAHDLVVEDTSFENNGMVRSHTLTGVVEIINTGTLITTEYTFGRALSVFKNTGVFYTSHTLSLPVDRFDNSGTFVTRDNLLIECTNGINEGRLSGGATLTLKAAKFTNKGVIECSDTLKGAIAITFTNSGNISVRDVHIERGGLAQHSLLYTLTAGTGWRGIGEEKFINTGTLTSQRDLCFKGLHTFENTGSCVIGHSVDVHANEIIKNSGVLRVADAAQLRARKIINVNEGLIEVGSRCVLDAKVICDNQGSVIYAYDIDVHAPTLKNGRKWGTIIFKGDYRYSKYDRSCKCCTQKICKDAKPNYVTTYGALIAHHDITLNTHDGSNKAGLIIADHHIDVTAQNFANEPLRLTESQCVKEAKPPRRNRKCTPYQYRLDTRAQQHEAVIMAGDTITFTLNGKRHVHGKGRLTQSYPRLKNTSFISAGETIDVRGMNGAHPDVAVFYNGIVQTRRPFVAREFRSEPLPLIADDTFNKHLRKGIDTVVYAPPVPGLIKAPGFFDSRLWVTHTGAVSREWHPQLPADIFALLIGHILYTKTGLPMVLNSGHATLTEQYVWLIENGFLFGLVNGNLTPIKADTASHDANLVSHLLISENADTELKEYALSQVDALCVTPYCAKTEADLLAKLQVLESGSHVLTVDPESIKKAPSSLIFAQPAVIDGVSAMVPHLYVSPSDFLANQRLAATLYARNIKLSPRHIENYGNLIALKKLHITTQSFINQRPVYTAHEMVVQPASLFGSQYTKRYEVIIPQTEGGLATGFEVEMEVGLDALTMSGRADTEKGFTNRGGTVFAQHRLYLVAKDGADQVNKFLVGSHVQAWDPGWLGTLLGVDNAHVVMEYHPGVIMSAGDAEIVAETGHVINLASHILSKKSLKIKSLLGIISQGLLVHNTDKEAVTFEGLSVASLIDEVVTAYPAAIGSEESSVTIESTDGKNTMQGTKLFAGSDIMLVAAKGNELKPYRDRVIHHQTRSGFELFGLYHNVVHHEQDYLLRSSIKAGGTMILKSGTNNVIEGVAFDGKTALYLIAHTNNYVNGAVMSQTTNRREWTVSMSTLPSDMALKLVHEECAESLWSMGERDPLIQSARTLLASQDMAAATVHTALLGIELLTSLFNYNDAIKQSKSKKQMLGERLGLIDEQGNFNPTIAVNMELRHAQRDVTEMMHNEFNVPVVYLISSGDTVLEATDLSPTQDLIVRVGGSFKIKPAVKTESTTIDSINQSVGVKGTSLVYVGVGGSYERMEQQQFDKTALALEYFSAEIGKDMVSGGIEFMADDVDGYVNGSLIYQPVENSFSRLKLSGGITVGITGEVSGHQKHEYEDNGQITEPGGITAKKLRLNVGKIPLMVDAFLREESGLGKKAPQH